MEVGHLNHVPTSSYVYEAQMTMQSQFEKMFQVWSEDRELVFLWSRLIELSGDDLSPVLQSFYKLVRKHELNLSTESIINSEVMVPTPSYSRETFDEIVTLLEGIYIKVLEKPDLYDPSFSLTAQDEEFINDLQEVVLSFERFTQKFFNSVAENSAENSLVSSTCAALPPWVQIEREKEAIQNDPRLSQFLGNQAILEIRQVEGGYLIITDLCEMRVDVHYLAPVNIGPAQFELVFHEPTPRI